MRLCMYVCMCVHMSLCVCACTCASVCVHCLLWTPPHCSTSGRTRGFHTGGLGLAI